MKFVYIYVFVYIIDFHICWTMPNQEWINRWRHLWTSPINKLRMDLSANLSPKYSYYFIPLSINILIYFLKAENYKYKTKRSLENLDTKRHFAKQYK